MNTYEKKLKSNDVSKDTVLKILELLQGENLTYSLDVLKTVEFVLRANTFLDYELAQRFVEDIGD